MKISFAKYQGTGNDFVLIDNRTKFFPKGNLELIRQLTKNKFGIGADGIILVENHSILDFEMVYFNADGSQSLCGNGSRCAVQFAKDLGIINNQTKFSTYDGEHDAFFRDGLVYFSLQDLKGISFRENYFFVNNGSPHYVTFVSNVENIDVKRLGAEVRYSKEFSSAGTNVNFVEIDHQLLKVRTYERGVEAETLSCGTGVTASAIVAAYAFEMESPMIIESRGGQLFVSFVKQGERFSEIYLAGPAIKVFEGSIDV
ncbi:MAG: diaminopimelate epimerase [Flammeovirgaceae bacterium]|nr:diaminopimelate epimerase [Flammeovirgaceae bacterium]|tara:strand:+ start:721 stop:1491 length:771 start_codon:yes stop_codon:yes gene_type:complete